MWLAIFGIILTLIIVIAFALYSSLMLRNYAKTVKLFVNYQSSTIKEIINENTALSASVVNMNDTLNKLVDVLENQDPSLYAEYLLERPDVELDVSELNKTVDTIGLINKNISDVTMRLEDIATRHDLAVQSLSELTKPVEIKQVTKRNRKYGRGKG